MIDIGANLTHESFRADFDAVLERARRHGVGQIVVTGASAGGSRAARELARTHPGFLHATAGVHPHHAHDYDEATDALLRELVATPEVKAVGETGLDYFRDLSPRPAQIAAFADLNGITRSMGLTGICWDNAMAESFFATLKTEFYYRRVWPTKAGAKLAVGARIEDRYNRRRRHSSIGQISPVAFELQYFNQTAADQKAA